MLVADSEYQIAIQVFEEAIHRDKDRRVLCSVKKHALEKIVAPIADEKF